MPKHIIAIILSLILPGAGHFYQGRIKAGWVLGIIGLAVFLYTCTYRMIDSYVWIILCIGLNLITRAVAVFDIIRKGNAHQLYDGYFKIRFISILVLAVVVPIYFLTLWPVLNVKIGIYQVPGTGNEPTIFSTDIIWVDYNYYKHHKFDYGDITVFDHKGLHFFYRIVGKPGDVIELRNNHLFINGDSCSLIYMGDTTYSETYTIPASRFKKERTESLTFNNEKYLEVLPNGKSHLIYLSKHDSLIDKEKTMFNVPLDHYFLMGDNRNGAMDSKYLGPINIYRLQGRVVRMVFSEKQELVWEDLRDQ